MADSSDMGLPIWFYRCRPNRDLSFSFFDFGLKRKGFCPLVLLCMRFLCFQFCIRAVARCGLFSRCGGPGICPLPSLISGSANACPRFLSLFPFILPYLHSKAGLFNRCGGPGFVLFRHRDFRLRKILAKCPDEFEAFRKCMDKSQMKYAQCRSQEKIFKEVYES